MYASKVKNIHIITDSYPTSLKGLNVRSPERQLGENITQILTSLKGLNVRSPERQLGVYRLKIETTLKGLNT